MSTPTIQATALHVDELVDRAMRGRVRVPRFQRGLRWRASDVQDLFDSIYRHFPIGTLLMWKRPAPCAKLQFGPVEVRAEKTDDAWWVVDGQQRLTSLVATLRHPGPTAPDDPFAVWFDLEPPKGQPPFFRPHRLRPVQPTSIPLSRVLDAADFQSWLFEFVEKTDRRDLIGAASELATRLRNYRVPVYVVETHDTEVAKEMFLRINRKGRRMEAHEVFAALAPTAPTDANPDRIAQRLGELYGRLEPNVVMKAAIALKSDDVTGGPDVIGADSREELMQRTERALRRALDFLVEVGIPHLRLLPARQTPVVTLARFFDRFSDPSDRSRRLIRRWLWRGFYAEALPSDAKTLRRAVTAVGMNEDQAVQALLAQVPAKPVVEPPRQFDARQSAARLYALVLAHRRPAMVPPEPETGLFDARRAAADDEGTSPDDIFRWIQQHDLRAFTALGESSRTEARFLTCGATPAELRDALQAWAERDLAHPALASHLISPAAAEALLRRDLDTLFSLRRESLLAAARTLYEGMAEPTHSDRPPLAIEAAE